MLDKRMPPRGDCVIRDLIERHARDTPDRPYVVFADGTSWTYGDLRRIVRDTAEALQRLGVRQGDFVVVWLPNGPECLKVMLALNYLGAVYVPINTSYRGGLLAHVIDNSGARLLIGAAPLLDRLHDVAHAELRDVVTVGGTAEAIPGLTMHDESVLEGDGDKLAPLAREIQPWDTLCIIYTSGTTGPSKGVLCSALQLHAMFTAGPALESRPDDRALVTMPMFHVGGAGPVWGALYRGTSFALVESFKTHEFWPTVRRFGITSTILVGAMTPFLLKEPASPADRDHTLRTVTMVPLSDQHRAFAERFGVEVHTAFNMTEISSPLSVRNPETLGTCGQPRAGVEVRVVDENDCEVEDGVVGELIVRTDMPWGLNHGYHRNPEATARAWRNGWFHTGDAFRRDASGNFFFVDRIKDAIRRRGENISSFEVEKEIVAFDQVRDVAVVGVPSEFGEDEVLAVMSACHGRNTIEFERLIDFLRPRLPHFMVPRYYRVVADLPRTPTEKVQKHMLRSEGVTTDTWDREKAGIFLKQERLSRMA